MENLKVAQLGTGPVQLPIPRSAYPALAACPTLSLPSSASGGAGSLNPPGGSQKKLVMTGCLTNPNVHLCRHQLRADT